MELWVVSPIEILRSEVWYVCSLQHVKTPQNQNFVNIPIDLLTKNGEL